MLAVQGKSASSKEFSDTERLILQNLLKLGDKRVDDVMVPRADIEAVEEGETIAHLIALFRIAAHSRLPVYDDSLDNMLGFIHIKDALLHLTDYDEKTNGGESSIKFLSSVLKQKIGNKGMVRKLLFVPPSMPVGDLLQKMQATHVHMAMVVDEYGGTDGLVTIEDLLEAVVGEIEDEHDENDEQLFKKIDSNVFIVDARIELTELEAALGSSFKPFSYVEDADTLGGLIFDLVDRVPVVGEVITKFKGYEFEILQADPRRIKKVCIRGRKTPPIRSKSISQEKSE
jgi:CBS domain containing-hemolysin-like protein